MLKQIGKFTISERIGRGTYSRVYRAVDPQGRAIAIKVATTQTEPEHLSEFQRDLVAAASVLHPDLVAVHDLGFEDDFPYIVMELVEGRDLDRILKSGGKLSLAERIRVMQQVGSALKSAHERGVFHLDVRPSKIMLSDDGQAKLLDLGLGRLSFDPARLTDRGYLIGSPFYMSPERLVAIDTANEQCDIWSFGVTLFEWISGRHPFYDDDGDRMIGNIMDAEVPRLADVPEPLNQVIQRALTRDQAERYRNFGELLADLTRLAGGLQREEDDALMAEALKQTDRGRWHEARRIARKLSEREPEKSPSSQIFGLSEHESEKPKIAARRQTTSRPAPPAAMPVVAASGAVPALETPEPAPPPIAPSPTLESQERFTPQIPNTAIGNGVGISENGSSALAYVQPEPELDESQAQVAAAIASAAARAAVAADAPAREPIVAPPAVEPPRPVAPPANTAGTTSPRQTVRILELAAPSGLPWAKIGAFSAAALLVAGALYYFLGAPSTAPDSTMDAKKVSPSKRIIRPVDSSQQPAAAAQVSTGPTTAAPSSLDANDKTVAEVVLRAADTSTPDRRVFDPKSLAPPKLQIPVRAGSMLKLAPPSLGGGTANAADLSGLPMLTKASVPPPPVVPAPQTGPTPVPPAQTPPTQISDTQPKTSAPKTETAEVTAIRLGGAFTQPVLIHSVQPVYPHAALERKMEGVVRFQATIGKDGSVKDLHLLSGDPLLNVAAKQAVLQWVYRPASLNGDPVEVTQAIVVKFNLSR